MFCDFAKIQISAGKGGDGAVSFLREKSKPRGGPDGGDGGRGGNVFVQINKNLDTLSKFVQKKHFVAEDGFNGGNNNKKGSDGKDILMQVPPGTIIYEVMPDGHWNVLADLVSQEEPLIIAKGGNGGFGNSHFATSVNQAPRYSKKGLPGEKKKIIVELKTIADVGLVGLPNSGKSTFLSIVTKARPKIANYPFTTLIPNLGSCVYRDHAFIIADIPGLISGASIGKGLGYKFLKHIERTKIIVHFIDIQSIDPVENYFLIRKELDAFSKHLANKKEIICFTKLDTVGWKSESKDLKLYIQDFVKKTNTKKDMVLAISAIDRTNIDKLMQKIYSTSKVV